jgi:hypothetical protein
MGTGIHYSLGKAIRYRSMCDVNSDDEIEKKLIDLKSATGPQVWM